MNLSHLYTCFVWGQIGLLISNQDKWVTMICVENKLYSVTLFKPEMNKVTTNEGICNMNTEMTVHKWCHHVVITNTTQCLKPETHKNEWVEMNRMNMFGHWRSTWGTCHHRVLCANEFLHPFTFSFKVVESWCFSPAVNGRETGTPWTVRTSVIQSRTRGDKIKWLTNLNLMKTGVLWKKPHIHKRAHKVHSERLQRGVETGPRATVPNNCFTMQPVPERLFNIQYMFSFHFLWIKIQTSYQTSFLFFLFKGLLKFSQTPADRWRSKRSWNQV